MKELLMHRIQGVELYGACFNKDKSKRSRVCVCFALPGIEARSRKRDGSSWPRGRRESVERIHAHVRERPDSAWLRRHDFQLSVHGTGPSRTRPESATGVMLSSGDRNSS